MRLIHNWRAVAARAHSMWAFYLSVVALVMPEVIYFGAGIDTNPRIWWFAGLVLLIYGIMGRLRDQGIDRRRSPLTVGLLGLVLAASLMWGHHGPAQAFSAPKIIDAGAPAASSAPLPVSDAVFTRHAVPHVGRWEGLRLTAYRDIVGVWTVCYGETKGVRPGDSYTRAECDAMLARELVDYRRGLHRYFTDDARARLPVLRDVAFVSLAYNAGIRAIGRSTATRRLNAGDVPGACQALAWWNKAGGRVIRGLVNRRVEERDLCLRGVA